MSSNQTHMISLSNYEEWFVLYMDDELTPAQKTMVDNFLLQHPQLQEEMDLLLSTKLPADEMTFPGKQDLHASAMKLNMVDEALLLYVDNELPTAERKTVEERINADDNYRLQLSLLQKTKLDPAEIISHPNKKELYRHTEKAVVLKMWMRIAVAVVLILFASLFFLLNQGKAPVTGDAPVTAQRQVQPKQQRPSVPVIQDKVPTSQPVEVATVAKARKTDQQPLEKGLPVVKKESKTIIEPADVMTAASKPVEKVSVDAVAPLKVDVAKLTQQPAIAVNNPVTNFTVTSATPASYNPTDTPEGTAGLDGDYKNSKRTSAKGFLRKVSRFLERRTGIGTVNADNEILVGAVALKLN